LANEYCRFRFGRELGRVSPNGRRVIGLNRVAEHKARAAVKFRRPTKAFEDAVQKSDYKFALSVDDLIAARGGIPLIEDGKIIGAIGCSGGAGSQDEVVCMAGASTINK
jgi:glc operon protein GlcG